MNTKEAVEHILLDQGISKYKLAQEMGAFPVSVNQWLSGTKMSDVNRALFFVVYGVRIDDSL
jgi:hypothetical protein